MFARHRLSHVLLLFPLMAVTLTLACGDNECGYACRRAEPTIENIWPNDDGASWTYEYTWRTWDAEARTYPERDSLPPVPSMDEIEKVFKHHAIGPNPSEVQGTYGLEFDSLTTTDSGVTAQNLVESVVATDGRGRLVAGTGSRSTFLKRLRQARPDLEARIDACCPDLAAAQPGEPPAPIMIHGGAWEKTGQWIGTYGDIDTLLAWKFLEADLRGAHEFTHQLIPSLASDVFLHCRVLGRTVVRSPGGEPWGAIECLYIVDYGPYEISGPAGPIRWQQFYDYGKVVYVPELGPVLSYERSLVATGETIGIGAGDIEVDLTGSSLDTD